MAITRYFRFKRKSDRCRLKGWAQIDVPYLSISVPGTLVDISLHGAGIRVVSTRLNTLQGQPAILKMKVPGWPRIVQAYVIIERHVAKPTGRLLGLRFVSIDDAALAQVEQYVRQHQRLAA